MRPPVGGVGITRCLSERALWSLSEGSGTAEERGHLARCAPCAVRMDRLDADLRLIGRALRDEPPPLARSAPRALSFRRVAFAAAVLLIVIGITQLGRRPPFSTPAMEDDGVAALGQMSADVFADGESGDAGTASDEVVSALVAAGPCEWQPAGCQDIAQPLF